MAQEEFTISRAFPRYEIDARVDYTGNEVMLSHRITNISLGGICLQTPAVEEIGTQVDLVINFPDMRTKIVCHGEVAWTNREAPCDMGIRFVGLDGVQREVLRRYLQAHGIRKGSPTPSDE